MIMEYEGKEYELVEVVGWGCAGCEFIKNKGCLNRLSAVCLFWTLPVLIVLLHGITELIWREHFIWLSEQGKDGSFGVE